MLTWYMNKVPYTGNAVRDSWGTGYGKTIVQIEPSVKWFKPTVPEGWILRISCFGGLQDDTY